MLPHICENVYTRQFKRLRRLILHIGPGIILLLLFLLCSSQCAVYNTVDLQMPAGTLSFSKQSPLFELYTTLDAKDKNARKLTDADFRNVTQTGSSKLIFSAPPDEWGGDIKVTVSFEPAAKEAAARIKIESDSYFPIRLVRFPVLETPQVRRYDTLLFSSNVGDLIHDPQVMIANRLGGIFSRRYPADMAMQYMVFFNEARSYYLATYNDGDEFYDHTVRTAGDKLRMSFDWYPFLDDGGKWESPECSVSILPGDWHSSADLYREHMGPKFRPPDLPKWMKESFHGWVQVSLKGGNPKPAYPYNTVPDFYRKYVQANGLNTLHVFSWAVGGADTHFPNTTPSPYLGPPEELAKAMDEIKAMGGHADLYTNGRSVDIDSDLYRATGDACLVKHEDGGPQIDGWGITPMRQACPYSKIYQDALVEQFRTIITKFRAHGCQIDQTSCTPAIFCFDESHGHRTPAANWSTGTDQLYTRIQDLYKSLDPDFFVWVEGVHERFGQFYEVNQSHGEGQNWSAGESCPEQFHYTYPDFLLTGLCDSIEEMCQTYGQGKPFDIHSRHLDNPEFAALLRKLIQVRKNEPAYFLQGLFRDTVGLNVASKDIRFWRIDRRDSGGTLVNFWGRGRSLTDKCEADIKIPDTMPKIRSLYPEDLKTTPDGGWLHLEWTGPLATVVFEPEVKK